MTELMRQVEKLLRNTETCRLAIEVSSVKVVGKTKKARCLAIVTNWEHQKEIAVLHVKASRLGKLAIATVFPILNDFRFKLKDNLQFEIHLPSMGSDVLHMEAQTEEDLRTFTAEIFRAMNMAREENFQWVGETHRWVIAYDSRWAKRQPPQAVPAPAPVLMPAAETGSRISSTLPTLVEGAMLRAAGPTAVSGVDNVELESIVQSKMNRTQSDNDVFRKMTLQRNDLEAREDWIRRKMKLREAEFTETKTVRVLLATYNVNGKKPGEDISGWLHVSEKPDVYAIGFQEIVDLTAQNVLFDDPTRCKPWEDQLIKTLGNDYAQVLSKNLVGVYLSVFVKHQHIPHIRDLQSDSAGIGLMGMMGNKGAVAIRFTFYDSSFCFICAHLSADRASSEGRNQGYHDILRRVTFLNDENASGGNCELLNHDVVFWMGDLNYRISLPDDEVREKIAEGDIKYLLEYDQLTMEKKAGAAFVEFTEAPITFPPTYKYDTGTNQYDTSEKQRPPAWCDRVLWKKGCKVTPVTYGRHELLTSDHKSVSSLFNCDIKVIVEEKRRQTHQQILRMLDTMENEAMPNIEVDRNMINLMDVKYGVPISQSITIENVGQIVAQFSFIPKLEEKRFCKTWLTVVPEFGMLTPGEKQVIRFTIFVDNITARQLNNLEDTLDEILILHLKNGRDYFITVSGKFHRSCFGSSLEQLCRTPDPVRVSNAAHFTKQLSLPKELWRMVDYIYTFGMDQEELFLISGDPLEMAHIREALDTGTEFEAFRVHSMAETLVQFLESLVEPIVPYKLYLRCLDSSQSCERCRQILIDLPPVHYSVFVYMIAFLREVLKHKEKNRLTAENLAVVFSNAFLHAEVTATANVRGSFFITDMLNQRKMEFLLHFLTGEGAEPKVTP